MPRCGCWSASPTAWCRPTLRFWFTPHFSQRQVHPEAKHEPPPEWCRSIHTHTQERGKRWRHEEGSKRFPAPSRSPLFPARRRAQLRRVSASVTDLQRMQRSAMEQAALEDRRCAPPTAHIAAIAEGRMGTPRLDQSLPGRVPSDLVFAGATPMHFPALAIATSVLQRGQPLEGCCKRAHVRPRVWLGAVSPRKVRGVPLHRPSGRHGAGRAGPFYGRAEQRQPASTPGDPPAPIAECLRHPEPPGRLHSGCLLGICSPALPRCCSGRGRECSRQRCRGEKLAIATRYHSHVAGARVVVPPGPSLPSRYKRDRQ